MGDYFPGNSTVFTRAKISPPIFVFLFTLLFLAYSAPYQQQLVHGFIHQKKIIHHHHDEHWHLSSEHSDNSEANPDAPHKHSFRSVSLVLPVTVIKIESPFHTVVTTLNWEGKDLRQPGFGIISFFSQAPPFFSGSQIYSLFPPHQAPPRA